MEYNAAYCPIDKKKLIDIENNENKYLGRCLKCGDTLQITNDENGISYDARLEFDIYQTPSDISNGKTGTLKYKGDNV